MNPNDPNSPDNYQGGGDSLGGIAALLALGGGLYDSYQDRKTSKRNVDHTIRAQKREAELAYQREIQMWHMQNAFNSPAEQMKRFGAAGLNPHLIYGQGNAGNATSMPQYHAADIQYKYAAPAYGAAVQSVIPTLMAVGTWMQNMRLSEAELKQKRIASTLGEVNTDKVRQMIDFLAERNPQVLSESQNRLSLFPYQKEMQMVGMSQARRKLDELNQEYRYKYGDELWQERWSYGEPMTSRPLSGIRRMQFLQEESKTKLAEAKASWADMDITDPQAIMMMVLQGVMGMAGAQLKMRTTPAKPKPRVRPRGLTRRGMSRNHPDYHAVPGR